MVKKNVIVSSVIVTAVLVACAAVYAEKHEGKIELPEAVKSAIKALYPAGEIEEAKMEKEGLKLYEVEVDANGVEAEITADAEGTIAEVTTKEKVESLPAAVAQTVTAQGGKVVEVGKEVTHARIKLVKLDAPVTKYEVKIEKDGKTTEIQIAADGKILKQENEKEKKECNKDKKDKDDDEDEDD
jgi:uncharacterized protein involved in high-affinity Fe2+ transport